MNSFCFVAFVCIFQTIRLSFACNGYSMEILDLQSGPENNIKFENDAHLEITDDCQMIVNSHMTVDRPYTSALISLKAKNSFMDIFTLKNVNLCKFVSDYHIVGLDCTSVEAVVVRKEFEGNANISEYGPFLGFLTGNFTMLFKIYFDGDDLNPDIFAVVFNIKSKNWTPLWF